MTNMIASYTPGATRTDSASINWLGTNVGWSGVSGSVISQLGIWKVAGNTGLWNIDLCLHSNAAILTTAVVNMTTAIAGQFNYASCTPFVMLNGASWILVANVPAGQTWNDIVLPTYNSGIVGGAGMFQVTPGSVTGSIFGTGVYVGLDMVFGPAPVSGANSFFFR